MEALLVAGHASCWHCATGALGDIKLPGFHSLITQLRDVRANQAKGKKRENEGVAFRVLFNFLGLGGGLLWLLSVLSLPCCR